MTIIKNIPINDEHGLPLSTGIRSASVTYYGKKYVYVEASKKDQKITAFLHASENHDMTKALDFANVGDDNLICIELNTDEHFLEICSIVPHSVSLEDYTETLPNGEIFEEKYPAGTTLSSFYDFKKMKFDHESKKFVENVFVGFSETDEQNFIASIEQAIDTVTDALEQNTYSAENLAKITTYKNELIAFRDNYDGSIKFWKLKFPVCTIPY